MGFRLLEHTSIKFTCSESKDDSEEDAIPIDSFSFASLETIVPYRFRSDHACFHIHKTNNYYTLKSDYYIGISWLGQSGRYVYVEPKINAKRNECFAKMLESDEGDESLKKEIEKEITKTDAEDIKELNYLRMLLDVMSEPNCQQSAGDLVHIFWDQPLISITQKEDLLTPFLVAQYLQLLRQIVRKGLRKSYYKTQEHLTNRVKGKILVSQNIKQNVLKNRFTRTLCEYQMFGEDNQENRFLKKALSFAVAYVESHAELFRKDRDDMLHLISYIRPAFDPIGNVFDDHSLKHLKYNPFFKEYKEAIKIGGYILKRFSFNITETKSTQVNVPPFWMDMPKLFELYVYYHLLNANNFDTSKIQYQFSTRGNHLDFLIKDGPHSMVIDAKYKLKYENGQVHQDIRQVAGYARLNKVLNELEKGNSDFNRDVVLPCLIIYPDPKAIANPSLKICNLINEDRVIKSYHKVYKLGIKLPTIGRD